MNLSFITLYYYHTTKVKICWYQHNLTDLINVTHQPKGVIYGLCNLAIADIAHMYRTSMIR